MRLDDAPRPRLAPADDTLALEGACTHDVDACTHDVDACTCDVDALPFPNANVTLDAELDALRRLLGWAVAAAEREPPRDPFLAATRVADAIVRVVRAQRALHGEPVSAAESAMLAALAELGLGEADGSS